MKKFLKRNWGKILLAVLLITISILSFKVGKSYLSNDNYSPDLNPLLTIQRSLESPAWRSYRVLGFASESEQADVFRAAFYYILDLFLPTWSFSQIFALLAMFVGSWFTGLLVSDLIKNTDKKKYSELSFLLGGIFYISTLWTVWVYYQNMFPYITQFGFLPLVIWSVHRFVKDFNWKNALILFVSSILFTSTFVIATLFVVDVLVIFIFTLIFALTYSRGFKNVFKKVFLTLVLFIFTQLFWILPFIHYTINVSGDIVDSYTNRTITTSVIDLESRDQDALNSAKLLTRSILEKEDDEYIFKRADEYVTYDFFNVIGLIPAILTVVLLIWGLVKKKWVYFALSSLSILMWFVIKNINPPLGRVFVWFQENLPLFKQVFRWASSKVGNVYLLLVSICAPLGFIYLIDFLGSFLKKGLKYVVFVLSTLFIVVPTLFYSQYLFTGEIFPNRAIVEIPNEYYEMRDFLQENQLNDKRILYLPMANNNYFRSYDWGFEGSNFISYIISNPIMDLSSSIGSKYGEEGILDIQEAFRAGNLEDFDELLSKYNIDYLLVDKTLNEEGFTYSWDWDEANKFWGNRDSDFSTKNLYLYSTNVEARNNLTESNSQESGTFSYAGDYQRPIISLHPEVYDNWNIEDSFLTSENTYKGKDVLLRNIASLKGINKFPTLLKVENGYLYLYPAIPFVNNIDTDVYKKYQFNNSDILIIDNKVINISDEYFAIEDSFDSKYNIYTLNNSDFNTEDLTSTLADSTPYECISGEKEESTTVVLQGDATGFELSGNKGNPCIYSQISLNRDLDKVIRVDINWETINNSLLGYCVYSQNQKGCLNNEKYFSAKEGIGNINILLEKSVSKSDYISLILYVLNAEDKPKVTVRNVSIGYGGIENKLNLLDQQLSDYKNEISLKNGDVYKVKIPILIGEDSYQLSQTDTVWQPNTQDNTAFTIYNDFGISQEVQEGFASSSINLFKTSPLNKYLLYWKGENISNIPANLCIAYSGNNKCWIQDIMYDNRISSNLNVFSPNPGEEEINLSLISTSYNLRTKNILNDLIFMKYPEQWQNIAYLPSEINTKTQVEASIMGNSESTIYSYSDRSSNSILTIPQAYESGWVAISIKENIPKILKNKVLVNGWKQGWDISNVDYDSIYVIYYPNLLAYLGYILLVVEFLVILVNLMIRKNGK